MNDKIKKWRLRKYSWSQHSSWAFDKSEWFSRYILDEATPETPALKFGKALSESVEWGSPMAPCLVYKSVEHRIEATLDGIPLIGYLDSYNPDEKKICELKTGVKKWDDKRVRETGQLTFYAMLLYLTEQIPPKSLHITLQWMPTGVRPDFTFGFVLNKDGEAQIHSFETSRTLLDVLKLCAEIKETRKEMHAYALQRLSV